MGAGSYVRKEFVGGAPATAVSGGITDSATSLTIDDATGWPTASTNPFVAVIDRGLPTEEKILVAARTGTALSSITRGYDDTVGQAHDASAVIEHAIDASTLDQVNRMANLQSAAGEILTHNGTNVVSVAAGATDDHTLIVDSGEGGNLRFGRPIALVDDASTPAVAGVPRIWYDQNQNLVRTSDGANWRLPANLYVFANDAARDSYLGGTPTTGALCIVGTGGTLELQVYDGTSWINFPRKDEAIPKFADTTARDAYYASPADGDHAYTTTDHKFWEYRDAEWIEPHTKITLSATSPSGPTNGDIWVQEV